jgi:hypothetical protein
MAPLEPHAWIDFGANGHGPDLSGQYWIKKLKRMHQFDDFAKDIYPNTNELNDWVDSFKKT